MDRLTYTGKGAGMADAIADAWRYIRRGRKSRKQLEAELEALAKMLDDARETADEALAKMDQTTKELKEARAEIAAMYEVIHEQLEEREELEDELRAKIKEAQAERDSWKAKAADKEKEIKK